MFKRKVKNTTKTITKEIIKMKRKINTTLIGKEEEFKMLELANTMSLPILLIGKPGNSKTKIVLDYMSSKETEENTYILETDESTPNSAIKGNIDLEKLFRENKFETIAPISNSKCILINEIDKASSMIRNSLLSIMNERILFSGKEKINCNWELFVATCNQIPRSENKSPLFDRFILKHEVSGISSKQMLEYFKNGGRDYKNSFEVNMPNKNDFEKIIIPEEKLKIFVEFFIDKVSNRTLTYMPNLIKAISIIWEIGIDQAMIKAAEIILSKDAATELISKLYTELQLEIISKVELLRLNTNKNQQHNALLEIEKLLKKYSAKSDYNIDFVIEVNMIIDQITKLKNFNLN